MTKLILSPTISRRLRELAATNSQHDALQSLRAALADQPLQAGGKDDCTKPSGTRTPARKKQEQAGDDGRFQAFGPRQGFPRPCAAQTSLPQVKGAGRVSRQRYAKRTNRPNTRACRAQPRTPPVHTKSPLPTPTSLASIQRFPSHSVLHRLRQHRSILRRAKQWPRTRSRRGAMHSVNFSVDAQHFSLGHRHGHSCVVGKRKRFPGPQGACLHVRRARHRTRRNRPLQPIPHLRQSEQKNQGHPIIKGSDVKSNLPPSFAPLQLDTLQPSKESRQLQKRDKSAQST
ncbi:hypothetical protein L1887_55780 [Cichorium endivia]|nr:hypothetical protein L1887_55780 [Cichorium endivia]